MDKWIRFPEFKPAKPGRYIVTYKHFRAGRWIDIKKWNGEVWERNCEVVAWMPTPPRYRM